MTSIAPKDLALSRAKQLLRFLKAYAERNVPSVRRVTEQQWSLFLSDLPSHASVAIGEVQLMAAVTAAAPAPAQDRPLLSIKRPKTTECPTPPTALLPWLQDGWRRVDAGASVRESRNETNGRETVVVRFDADADRVSALSTWRGVRDAWLVIERPAREALKRFEELYSLRARVQAESERVELMLGDGRLRWQRDDGVTDHPVLLQRVDLEFIPEGPEIRVVDAERAPELAVGMLSTGSSLSPQALGELRNELEERGYHPLEREATSTFLKRLATMLHARGQFDGAPASRAATAEPHLSRDPVLFLRLRQSGFAAAFERLLADLERESSHVPLSVSLLTGVDRKPDELPTGAASSPWGEPHDVLLSKPANTQQVQIARALDRHKAVLVQGPPGTGKSHTISNLIGHLVANGLRVLVTSQTTKALRVLRGHVVESVQALCVSVLESDLDSRRQMEGAVRSILSRLTESSPEELEREVANLSEDRSRLLREMEKTTGDLRIIREGEYQEIVVAGESKPPSDAARWVTSAADTLSWVPEPVDAQAPLPLSDAELRELYSTNEELPHAAEAELAETMPGPDEVPPPQVFEELMRIGLRPPRGSEERWWLRPATEDELPALTALLAVTERMSASLATFTPWQLALISAGHEGEAATALWLDLMRMVQEGYGVWERTRPVLLEYDCELGSAFDRARARHVCEQLRDHVKGGGGLGSFSLLLHSEWKAFLSAATVNGVRPSTTAHFAALDSWLELQEFRGRISQRWTRQAMPVGLPASQTIADPVEPVLRDYVSQFPALLEWWKSQFGELQEGMRRAGFDWSALRQHVVAASGPAEPYARDVQIVRETLVQEVRARVAHADHRRAARVLAELATSLAPFRGRVGRALAKAVVGENGDAYRYAYEDFQRLLALRPTYQRRATLLARLEKCAPSWATALRGRTSPHDSAHVPGDALSAWKWRQYSQELARRASLNEQVLMERLHLLQAELRRVTSELIDRRAWLGQIRRIDLPSRQALQGWTDIQRKIGKGTGKRVPELQAEARRLLAKARNAVPVWIMPLNRVADSMDLSQGRFDVVIIDEASQSDVTGLLAWFLGDRVCVVGDHEQVSPLAVGQKLDEVSALINEHLTDIPNAKLYDGKTSIYDLARQSFGATIALREHFRCVPDIIDFSNHLAYDGEILPLRDPTRVARPHVVEFSAPTDFGSGQNGKTNLAEARSVAALFKAAAAQPAYAEKSFGAITLLGDEQAELIQRLMLELMGAVELDKRRFVAGNAAQFQGDERDVIFLSMVHSPTAGMLRMTQDEPTKQRYNVAASRARDQLWLVHSLDPNSDLQQNDLRRRLIEHVRNPAAMRDKVISATRKAESPFEVEVIRRLVGEGYHVEPQVWVGRYRLDMVVRGGDKQVAVECDGDRFHGFDQIPADLARQAILERVGWQFARIRGTRFYRHPEEAITELRERLAELGVTPAAAGASPPPASSSSTSPLIDEIIRNAWQIARDQEWIVPSPPQSTPVAGTI